MLTVKREKCLQRYSNFFLTRLQQTFDITDAIALEVLSFAKICQFCYIFKLCRGIKISSESTKTKFAMPKDPIF